MRISLSVVVLGAVLVGCGPSSVLNEWDRAEINDEEDLREWSSGSAPQMFSLGLLTAAIVSSADESAEGGCPVRTVSGDTVTYVGDCTDDAGNAWIGKVTVTGVENGEDTTGSYRFDKFGFTGEVSCGTETYTERLEITGSTVSESSESGTFRFTYDMRWDQSGVDESDCTEVGGIAAYSYTGTRTESGNRYTWNGSGRFGQDSRGTVEASTVDEVTDSSVCNSEALSGTTTLKGKDATAVITYDGETDCSDQSTVTWTLNGEAMGTVSGIDCAAASGTPWGFALLGLLALGLKRRRA